MQELISISWNIIKFDENSINKTLDEILKSRFLEEDLEKTIFDLYDPYLLKDMDKAVERIKKAKKNDEKIIIFWDYDVDWVTSTSILMHFFKKIWMQVSYRLPHRVNDWYWLKSYFVDEVAKLWVTLIITVDCWTRDIDIIKHAKSMWIDIIVTDHHAVPEVIPEEAIAIINPKRKDCEYPFKDLAWAWVAFKLMMALSEIFLPENERLKYITESIDIAAIWTVADCMPLIWENRIIVVEWLKQIKNSRSSWMRKLIEERIHDDLDADIFWFLIWPRLNAAWRLDTPYKAVNLILNNSDKIDDIIYEIEEINNKRKELTKVFYENALENIDNNNNILFYDSSEIEHWIIWIVAGKLTEEFHKPSIVLKNDGKKLIASCRSPGYFSIIEILEKYKSYFLHFWGHKQAAWFSIAIEKYEDFKNEIIKELNNYNFKDNKKTTYVDKIVDVSEFWFNLMNITNKYKPYWFWNTKPIFMFKDFEITWVTYLWKTMEHIIINNKYDIKVVWFGFWKSFDILKKLNKVNIIFDLMEDKWMGKTSLKAKIIDIIF
jgi:single-stranded-DNA-specific exonuclease